MSAATVTKAAVVATYQTRDLKARLEHGTVIVPLNGADLAQVVSVEAEHHGYLTTNPLRFWPSSVHPGCIEVFLQHHSQDAEDGGPHPDTTLTVRTEPLRLRQKITQKMAPARRLKGRMSDAWAVLLGRAQVRPRSIVNGKRR